MKKKNKCLMKWHKEKINISKCKIPYSNMKMKLQKEMKKLIKN